MGLNHAGTYSISLTKFPGTPGIGIYNPQPAKACNQESEVSLTWDPVGVATDYDVFFGTNVLAPLDQIGFNQTETTINVSGLDKNTVYYWKVIAHTPSEDIPGTVNWFCTELSGDINGDCTVNLSDFNILKANWLQSGVEIPGDLNDDGIVNLSDFNILKANWLASCCCQ